MTIASAPARKPSFCTMYSFTPSSSKITISPGTVGASKASPEPRLARSVWKKNFSPVRNFRDRAPRKPPSILLSMSMVGEQATMAPDSALIFSPAANSTRTMGKAPGYKISLFIPTVSFFYNHTPAAEGARVALRLRASTERILIVRGARTRSDLGTFFSHRYPSIHSATGLRSFFEITHSKLAQRIFRHLVPFRTHIDPKNPCCVTAKDLFLYLPCQRLIVMPLDQLIGNLKSPKCFDLPLRSTIPDRIRAPKHVIHAERIDELPEHMRADRRMGCDELGKGRAELHVDILDSRLGLLHTAKLCGPGNLARLGKHLIHHQAGLEPRVID